MGAGRIAFAIVGIWLSATATMMHARAQDAQEEPKGEGLSEILTDILRGNKNAPDPAVEGLKKRVPFGQADMQLSFAPLVKNTAPAVVNVYASSLVRQRSPFEGDPFFERFFGAQVPPRVKSSLGSGVILDQSGIVVTNFHVIRDAEKVKVAMSDGREFESKVLLKDEQLDLAVLKIESKDPFPVIPLGDSDALEVGDLVLAMGNPFGVGQTTTSGIVSGLARTHIGVSDFGFFIQTDAAINPGNSGGPLINMGGQLIGINTAIFSRSGGSIGIGFAIPSNMVNAVVESAKAGSDYFERPYIGATFQHVDLQVAESLGMERPAGALVASVTPNGPAARGGLTPGDVILSMNGVQIEHVDALAYRLATQPVDKVVSFEVLSQGSRKTVEVKLERVPEGAPVTELQINGRSPFAGAKIAALSPCLAQRLGLSTETTGVAVLDVAPGSPAASFGLKPKDIVREVNGETIDSAEKLQQLASEDTRWWRFMIERDGRMLRQMLRY